MDISSMQKYVKQFSEEKGSMLLQFTREHCI